MTETTVVRIHSTGGPDALVVERVSLGPPAPGEVQIRQDAVGVNFIDTYHRSGLYSLPQLPSGLGMEAAGVVAAVGDGVDRFTVGDPVCYPKGPPGAYASLRNIDASLVLSRPSFVGAEEAAAMMVKGMTVEYLVRRCFPVESGHTVLLHAAAGGVGLVANQWLAHLGATVIGTVSTEAKAQRAKAHGCAHTIQYTEEDFVDRTLALTNGDGVDVVYDSVGKTTLHGSLRCLKRRGTCVSFGNASGAPEPVDPLTLSKLGSLFLTRPSLMHYIADRDELEESAAALWQVLSSGAVKASIHHRWPLEEAAGAHRALEARQTTGSIILEPK